MGIVVHSGAARPVFGFARADGVGLSFGNGRGRLGVNDVADEVLVRRVVQFGDERAVSLHGRRRGPGTLYVSVSEEVSGYGQVGITLEKFPEVPRMSSARPVFRGKLEES
jgi:hypothetical protein